MRLGLLCLALVFLVGCDDTDGGRVESGVVDDDAGPPGVDAGPSDMDAGPSDMDAGPADTDAGPGGDPFVAPADTWTGVEIAGASCGNGTPLHVAVNLHEGADRVFLYLQGGGACWDALTCFTLSSATHIEDTLDGPTVVAEATGLDGYLFSRSIGPFANATYVYVPYCTGDLHGGSNVATYGARDVHHVGGDNTELILARLRATVPSPSRVYVGGASAGGYGSTINFWRARAAWPGVRVDVLNDSGTTVEMDATRYAAAIASWNPQVPADCTDCLDSFTNWLPYYARTVTELHRFALLSFRRDNVIATYFGITQMQFETRYDALAAEMATTSYQRSFSLNGPQHVVLTDPTRTNGAGLSAAEWITRFVNDDPSWDSEGP